MKIIKRISALMLVAALMLSFAACGGKDSGETTIPEATFEPVTSAPIYKTKVAALYGPFGMASTLLSKDRSYAFEIEYYSTFGDVTSALKEGTAEIATLPLNEAVMLHNETGGKIKIFAISNSNFIHIVSKDASVKALADLKTKKIAASGEGTLNDKQFRYLCEKAGFTPKIEYYESYDKACESGVEIILLPEPYASKQIFENSEFSIAFDMGKEWESILGVAPAQGCLVTTDEYIAAHSKELSDFITFYEVSVNFMTDVETRKYAIAEPLLLFGFFADPDLALSAAPNAGMVCVTGEELKDRIGKNIAELIALDPNLADITAPGDAILYAAP